LRNFTQQIGPTDCSDDLCLREVDLDATAFPASKVGSSSKSFYIFVIKVYKHYPVIRHIDFSPREWRCPSPSYPHPSRPCSPMT